MRSYNYTAKSFVLEPFKTTWQRMNYETFNNLEFVLEPFKKTWGKVPLEPAQI